MRAAINENDVEELEFASADNRVVAGQLVEWAEQPHPADEISARELLTRAGEQLEYADDVEGAIALYRRAIDTPGDALLDPRSHLVSLRLRRGEREEADALDRELRRAGPATSATYEYMSEVWAEHGEDQRALGWVTRGILRHEQGPPFSDVDLAMLCLARWQLREPAGHPPDDYDLIGIGMRERMAERAAQQGLGAAGAAGQLTAQAGQFGPGQRLHLQQRVDEHAVALGGGDPAGGGVGGGQQALLLQVGQDVADRGRAHVQPRMARQGLRAHRLAVADVARDQRAQQLAGAGVEVAMGRFSGHRPD